MTPQLLLLKKSEKVVKFLPIKTLNYLEHLDQIAKYPLYAIGSLDIDMEI